MNQEPKAELTAEQKRMTVVCSACGEEYKVRDDTAVRQRPVVGHEEITEYGLVCPHCNHWQHIMLDGPKLKRYRNSVQMKLAIYKKARTDRTARAYRKAQRRYKSEYNRFHEEWRHRLGLVGPGQLLGPDDIGGPDAADEEE